MSTPEQAQLQQIAQMVEANRAKMEAIEQQIRKLEQIRLEQVQTMETLAAIPKEGAKGAMIPLGSGVQIVADIPSNTGAVIDIGSRVQAEKTLQEAITILESRGEEILALIGKMKIEFDELEEATITLANQFNEMIAPFQATESEASNTGNSLSATTPPSFSEPMGSENSESNPPSTHGRRKRKRGTELTLDD